MALLIIVVIFWSWSRQIEWISICFIVFWHYVVFKNILHDKTPNENHLKEYASKYNLSPRELETLELLSKGYSNKAIGDELFISLSTVKKHVSNIFDKTGTKSRMELINSLGR